MSPPALRALIRRILLPIFIVSLLAGAGGLYLLLYNEAIRQAEQEARIMLSSARAVGEYTETHILPKFTAALPDKFEPEQVPFYASRTVFRAVTGKAALYNGFGWQMHDTVGMEILTVPLTEQLRGTLQLVLFLAGGLLLIFVVAYVTLSIVFDSALVRPLSALASAAAAASQTGEPELHAPRSAVREIRVLAEALERMRLSMTKAMSALARTEARAPEER